MPSLDFLISIHSSSSFVHSFAFPILNPCYAEERRKKIQTHNIINKYTFIYNIEKKIFHLPSLNIIFQNGKEKITLKATKKLLD